MKARTLLLIILSFFIFLPFTSPAYAVPGDCDDDGIPDVCEIDSSADASCAAICASNPGECDIEGDCDLNGIPDTCDTDLSNSENEDLCKDGQDIGPTEINGPGFMYMGTTLGEGPENTATSCGGSGSQGSPSVYYIYTPLTSGTATVSLCGSSYDTLLSVHSDLVDKDACPVSSSNEVACNDDHTITPAGQTCGALDSVVQFSVIGGLRYYVRIAGGKGPGDEGDYKLTFDGPPSVSNRRDCDANNVPDQCQTDTDSDGFIDTCDNCPDDANDDQLDTDFDGVGDVCDLCPTDASKTAPGACGCGVADTDTDSDGTADCNETCDDDPLKLEPGICGCGVADTDTDSDGTADCNETCDDDPLKTEPGICGCGVADTDTDSDGTADCNETCDDDPLKTEPGICGCGVADTDTDSDGTADCNETCDDDPLKTEPGICGCGVADTDTDSDGTADCNETCDDDPLKTEPGICGCGVADTDTDSDGTADCNETCDDDPLKTEPGICGCGVADTDTDSDGTADCNETCDDDPLKTEPGICGCGVADTDTDSDGTADCNETCDDDPLKLEPGICGCGVADTDTDSDGTADCNETCDDDPLKTEPGICGCGVADTDTDSDGTADCNETCVDDPLKTEPGICGCGVADTDTDSDGTADCNETCDDDPLKTEPGACGCGTPDTDTDSDGTADCNETCDDDPLKTEPGICGCGVQDTDTDSDGTADCNETCVDDPLKTEPGICGCGVADTDTDSDGTADCNETCDDDPLKTEPGICGCGVADTDTDSDGTADCNETCDDDPLKTEPGACGCGTPDTDTDSDGTADCNETCDDDPLKTEPGICGCGTADTDTDSDGTADCNETCDDDPLKTEPGICGCGTADTDTDSDGTADCNETCDDDPLKTEPGICGCGTEDTDTDSDGTADCNETCDDDPLKTEPGICGCGEDDSIDLDADQIADCIDTCIPLCDDGANANLDSDGDGVSNCKEVNQDRTDPCDAGSFNEELDPFACAGPNGFFFDSKENIATIQSQSTKTLDFLVEYRDLFGLLRGSVEFSLAPNQTFDVLVSELGLEPDSYGTLCVYTSATEQGEWSGGLVIYKQRKDDPESEAPLGLSPSDYALFYQFKNPTKGASHVSLNTFTINSAGSVANWVRISDGTANDGLPITGVLNFYKSNGKIALSVPVVIPDGGRYDYSGHDAIGLDDYGLAEFIPDDLNLLYYIDATRYHYESLFTAEPTFFSAYVVPVAPLSGALKTSRVDSPTNEIPVVEMVNGSDSDSVFSFNIFDEQGNASSTQPVALVSKSSYHKLITAGTLAVNAEGNQVGSFGLSGPPESGTSTTVVYSFDGAAYEFGYALPFVESEGVTQYVNYNSFLEHNNSLTLTNTRDVLFASVAVTVFNQDGSVFKVIVVDVDAKATEKINLDDLPANSIGLIKIVAPDVGIIAINTVTKKGEYKLIFVGS